MQRAQRGGIRLGQRHSSPARSRRPARRCPSSASGRGRRSTSRRARGAGLEEVLGAFVELGGSVVDSSPMYGRLGGGRRRSRGKARRPVEALPGHQGVDVGQDRRHPPDGGLDAQAPGDPHRPHAGPQPGRRRDAPRHAGRVEARGPRALRRRDPLHRRATTTPWPGSSPPGRSTSCRSTTRSASARRRTASCRWRGSAASAVLANRPVRRRRSARAAPRSRPLPAWAAEIPARAGLAEASARGAARGTTSPGGRPPVTALSAPDREGTLDYDVIVVGGGPAGCAFVRALGGGRRSDIGCC